MPFPLLYEINTRCWLRGLAGKHGRPVRLGDVPEEEFDQWERLGFTHIWLMGAWTTGARARAHALNDPNLRAAFDKVLPGWKPADVPGSPYAVSEFRVPRALGGEHGLRQFRKQLKARGLKLVLDFIPNHLGLDHPWVRERADLFVRSAGPAIGAFPEETPRGTAWIAHGKDPYFPPWVDTAQLDFRRADTHHAMTELLVDLAAKCDGLRCDMSMLLLQDVFARTWESFPCLGEEVGAEFWPAAIAAVKSRRPDFLFLGEVYWDLEPRLQEQGFDFTYDKWLYDHLAQHNYDEAQDHLLQAPPAFIARSAHFLENHDELRIASWLPLTSHRPAALLVLGMPGMRLLHDGQLTGAQLRLPVQLGRRLDEPADPEVVALYEGLLTTLKSTAIGRGRGALLKPVRVWGENHTDRNFILVHWQLHPDEFDLVVVNLAPYQSQCFVPLPGDRLGEFNWHLADLLGPERYNRTGAELVKPGLFLDVPGHAAQVFHFTPKPRHVGGANAPKFAPR
ncbi:MAG: alpha-amylase [Verrucomicrobia bacterium]|nr:alpha-amylase [Verrucomicrobiota bacterium]